VLVGEFDGKCLVKLNGIKFEANLREGHKTGMYLDQQVNYQAVSRFAAGGQTLDCFSFLGGFGLHAAREGAAHVHCLDQSAQAIEASQRNAAANGLADKCTFETVNVFDWLKAQTAARPHEKVVPRFAQPRRRARRIARLQGNPLARAQAPQTRRCARHVLLFSPCQRRIVSGHAPFRRLRYPQTPAPRRRLFAITGPPDYPDDSGNRISQRVCLRNGRVFLTARRRHRTSF
jgi:hypothetical protein